MWSSQIQLLGHILNDCGWMWAPSWQVSSPISTVFVQKEPFSAQKGVDPSPLPKWPNDKKGTSCRTAYFACVKQAPFAASSATYLRNDTFYSFCCALQEPPKAAARVPKRCALFDSDSDDDAPTIATKPEPPAPQCGPAQTLPSPKSALTESKCPNLSPPAPIATAVPLARPEALSVAQRKGLFESDEGPPTATSQPKCQAQGSVQVSAKTAVCAAPVVTRPHPKSKGLFDSGDEDSGLPGSPPNTSPVAPPPPIFSAEVTQGSCDRGTWEQTKTATWLSGLARRPCGIRALGRSRRAV